MTHPYKYHVDVRDTSGFYLGALTRILEGRRLVVHSCNLTTMRHTELASALALPPVVVRELSIPLTLWTICKRGPETILWSKRDCIVVGDGDFLILLDGGYIVPYNEDPFIDDTQNWITNAQNRRDQ